MATYLELAKQLQKETSDFFYIADNAISSEFMDNILQFESDEEMNEEVTKEQFKKDLVDSLVDGYEFSMDSFYIKTSEDALNASFDAKNLGEDLVLIENF